MWCFGKKEQKPGSTSNSSGNTSNTNPTVTRLAQEVDRNRRKIADLQRSLESSEDENKKLWADLQTKTKAITGLTKQLSTAESSRTAAKARYEKSSKERDSLHRRLDAMQLSFKDLDSLMKATPEGESMSVEDMKKARHHISKALQYLDEAQASSSSHKSRSRSPYEMNRSSTQPSSSAADPNHQEGRRVSRSSSAAAASSRHHRHRSPERRSERLGQSDFMKQSDKEIMNTGSDFGDVEADDKRYRSPAPRRASNGRPPASPLTHQHSPSSSPSPSRPNPLSTGTSCHSNLTDLQDMVKTPSSSRFGEFGKKGEFDTQEPRTPLGDTNGRSRDQNFTPPPSPGGTPGGSRKPARVQVDSAGRVVIQQQAA